MVVVVLDLVREFEGRMNMFDGELVLMVARTIEGFFWS